jgi:hypothetical protein
VSSRFAIFPSPETDLATEEKQYLCQTNISFIYSALDILNKTMGAARRQKNAAMGGNGRVPHGEKAGSSRI